MSSAQNPFESFPQIEPGHPPIVPLPPAPPRQAEDPPWTGWDVLVIILVTIVASLVFVFGLAVLAKLIVYRASPWSDVARLPELALLAQLLTYLLVFVVMYLLVEIRTARAAVGVKANSRFWQAVRWNWPRASWGGFLAAGAVLYFVLAGVGQLLPIPKHLPIDRFFDNAREATLMSIFAVTLAPLMEELFFRGFLYPVLARRLGVGWGILLTSAAFSILHGAQLKYSWAMLIIFLVGVALTTVRAIAKSVAASFLLHVGYNGALSLLMFIATDRFRHLEKLNQ